MNNDLWNVSNLGSYDKPVEQFWLLIPWPSGDMSEILLLGFWKHTVHQFSFVKRLSVDHRLFETCMWLDVQALYLYMKTNPHLNGSHHSSILKCTWPPCHPESWQISQLVTRYLPPASLFKSQMPRVVSEPDTVTVADVERYHPFTSLCWQSHSFFSIPFIQVVQHQKIEASFKRSTPKTLSLLQPNMHLMS